MLRLGLLLAALLLAGRADAQPGPLPPNTTGTVNVLTFGAKGDARSIASCSVTAAATALTCSGSSFTASDVGKWIVVRTAGAAAASHVTTIASYTSATSMGLTDPAVSTATTARVFYGSDDTAAFTSAVAAASARGWCVYLPSGSYGLYSATTSIVMQNTCLVGDPMISDRSPYVDKGSNLLIFNASTATFKQGFNVSYTNIGFFWPVQDGSQPTPIAYPALISGPDATYRAARMNMNGVTFINPYTVIEIGAANAGTGAWIISDVRSYCILTCINFLGGSTAYITISQWINSPTTFGAESNGGSAYLAQWTNSNGSMFTVDVAGAVVDYVTGFYAVNTQAYGVSGAINLKSGQASIWELVNFVLDGSQSMMLSAGAAIWENSVFTGGFFNCQQPFDASVSASCFDLNSTGNNISLRINGATNLRSAGHFIYDRSGTSLKRLVLLNSKIENFGQSTTAAQYYGVNVANGLMEAMQIENNQFFCDAAVGSTARGVRINSTVQVSIVGNQFRSCEQALLLAPAANARWEISKNNSRLTNGSLSFQNNAPAVTGATIRDDNNWDKPNASTITSGFGTGPTIACSQNGFGCRITIGSAPGGSGIMAFPWTRASIPSCTATSSAAVALGIVATTTNVTVSGSFTAADVISVSCAGS